MWRAPSAFFKPTISNRLLAPVASDLAQPPREGLKRRTGKGKGASSPAAAAAVARKYNCTPRDAETPSRLFLCALLAGEAVRGGAGL